MKNQSNLTRVIILFVPLIISSSCGYNQTTKSEKILEFVFQSDTTKEWYNRGILVSDVRTPDVTVSDSLTKEMISINNSDMPWAEKLSKIASRTPLYVGVQCEFPSLPIKSVIDNFGEPETIQIEELSTSDYLTSYPRWYHYGSIKLAVLRIGSGPEDAEECIWAVHIDGPRWQKEIED